MSAMPNDVEAGASNDVGFAERYRPADEQRRDNGICLYNVRDIIITITERKAPQYRLPLDGNVVNLRKNELKRYCFKYYTAIYFTLGRERRHTDCRGDPRISRTL